MDDYATGIREEVVMTVREVVASQGELLELIRVPQPAGRETDALDGGQQQADENGEDADHQDQL